MSDLWITETVSHLFLKCSVFVFLPLNKIVLYIYILRNISLLQITYSERGFRFFELPTLDRFSRYLALVLLSESRHLIWTSRNCRKHENKNLNALSIVSTFFLTKLSSEFWLTRNVYLYMIFMKFGSLMDIVH